MTQPGKLTMARAMREAGAYHKWIVDEFAHYLRQGGATLEIGAGHGEHTALLAAAGLKVTAVDIDPVAVEELKRKFAWKEGVEVMLMDGADAGRLPGGFDNVVAVNVMEHIEDDLGFLRSVWTALKPGGRLALFAPAFPMLYSSIDAQGGHFRRYRRAGLHSLARQAGFEVIKSRYFNFVGFFGWWLNKLAGAGLDSASTNAQVRLFDRLVPIIRKLDVFSPLCGQSVIMVAEKKSETREVNR